MLFLFCLLSPVQDMDVSVIVVVMECMYTQTWPLCIGLCVYYSEGTEGCHPFGH